MSACSQRKNVNGKCEWNVEECWATEGCVWLCLNNYRWQCGLKGCPTVWIWNRQGDQRREGDRLSYILTGFRLKMINYLPGFFGPSEFLRFLLRCVPRGPGGRRWCCQSRVFFFFSSNRGARSAFICFFSPFVAWQESPVWPDQNRHRHSRQLITWIVFHPLLSITLSLQFKLKKKHPTFPRTCDWKKEAGLYQWQQTSAGPLFQHSHYFLLAYLTMFLQGVPLPSPIFPHLPLHPSFITSTPSSSAPPPSLYPLLYIFLGEF